MVHCKRREILTAAAIAPLAGCAMGTAVRPGRLDTGIGDSSTVSEGTQMDCVDSESLPGDIIRQTLAIRVDKATGTAFTIEIMKRQYLVTARHLLGTRARSSVELKLAGGGWQQVGVRTIGLSKEELDIAVLAADGLLAPPSDIRVGVDTIEYGQQVRFLGYPFGLESDLPSFRLSPLPMVKAGIFSGLRAVGAQSGEAFELFVDATGNPGFSGGPVILRRKKDEFSPGSQWCIAGVVSAGLAYTRELRGMDGKVIGSVEVDAGILRAVSIDVATRIVHANPVGHPV